MSLGDLLPRLRTEVPGPRSRALGSRLRRVESRNVTRIDRDGPIFWAEAAGSNVVDVDGNLFIDLTAGFGVAAAGHASPAVVEAVSSQMTRLPHAMGDVQPAERKVELLEALAGIAPGDLSVAILSANGADAVESALKTALLATGRPGVIAFEGAYHGLGHGALAVTHDPRFRGPFEAQLYRGVRFAPYPATAAATAGCMAAVRHHVEEAAGGPAPVGAVIAEPIQGRGGFIVPPDDFLPSLRALADEAGLVLILDEIYTGLGRTGRWFACEHQGVVPDILLVGKALGGGLPLSAAVGRPAVMEAWPPSEGEAIHTSTFLGNPVTAAAAIAHLEEIRRLGLVDRARQLGDRLARRLDRWIGDGLIAEARGIGLMQAGVPTGPGPEARAAAIARSALRDGVLLLAEGAALAFTPPLTITETQLDYALGAVERALFAP
jgi:4-aminobutyrate aminotransferase-like enzyme